MDGLRLGSGGHEWALVCLSCPHPNPCPGAGLLLPGPAPPGDGPWDHLEGAGESELSHTPVTAPLPLVRPRAMSQGPTSLGHIWQRKGCRRPYPQVTLPACSPALLPMPGPLPALSRCEPAYTSTSAFLCPPCLYLQLLDFRRGGHLLILYLGPSPAAKLTILILLLTLSVVVLADGGWARELCPWGRAWVTPALPLPTPQPSSPAPHPVCADLGREEP